MIKAVIFDLGGVVLDFSNKSYYRYLATLSKKSNSYIKTIIEKRQLPLLEKGMITTNDFEESIASKLHIKKEKVRWLEYYEKRAKINSDVEELIETLHGEYMTAFLSNVDMSRYSFTLKLLDLDLFDFRFPSCYIGKRKPSPEIYKYVTKKMHIRPENAVFIDDRIENVIGARKVGLNAVRFTGRRKLDIALARMGL